MIKVCELVRRRPGMTVDDFQHHWRHVHGPIVSAVPGLRRYVQSHTLPGGYRRGDPIYDGVAELWFDDKAALAAIADTDSFRAAKADEPNFIDPASLVELVMDEVELKAGPVGDDAVKSIGFVRLKRDVDPVEAHRYWTDVHGPLAVPIPQLRRYVQSHVRPGAYRNGRRPVFDGLALTWFDSVDDMRASARTAPFADVIADGPLTLDPAGIPTPTILTREVICVG
ncbi:MAG: EthD family reductase [Acidimicrobiales bacterium]